MRNLTYVQAINEALYQLLESDSRVILIGQGVNSPWYVGTATKGLVDKFGKDRVIDTPVSENGMTGVAIGAAIAGQRPILMFPRMDFMYYALDQIANHAATWGYLYGVPIPLVIWAIINRGGEQACQHSQALQSIFCHIPNLKVVAPSTPYDAKGLLIASACQDSPTIFIDDRWLYNTEGDVPQPMYDVSMKNAFGCKLGRSSLVTVVSSSYLTQLALEACKNIEADVIDLRILKPIDIDYILESVKNTGRLVVVDGGWQTCGLAAEIVAQVAENTLGILKAPIKRVCLPDTPAPMSKELEKNYYPDVELIESAIGEVINYG